MSFADYWENRSLILLKADAANWYIALSLADPLDDGSGLTEPVGGNYSRVQTTPATDWGIVGSTMANTVAIPFPLPSALWGEITHFAGLDASSGGNMLFHAQLTLPYTIIIGVSPRFPISLLQITLD